MYDHAMDKGYINSKGQLLGPPTAPNIGFMTPVAQFGITRQYNRWLKELGQYDASMKAKGLPTGFVQAIGMAPTLLETFYDPEGETKLRDVSTEPVIPITDDQITETPAPDTSGDGGTDGDNNTTSTQVSPSSGESFYETTYGNIDDYQGFTDSGSSSGGTFSSPQQTQQSYSSMYKDTDKPEGDAGI